MGDDAAEAVPYNGHLSRRGGAWVANKVGTENPRPQCCSGHYLSEERLHANAMSPKNKGLCPAQLCSVAAAAFVSKNARLS